MTRRAAIVAVVVSQRFGGSLPRAYLCAWLVSISLPLGALPLLMVLERAWPGESALAPPLRFLLAGLPILSLLAVPVLLDLKPLYAWTASAGVAPHGFAAHWLRPSFFSLRSIVYLVVWNVLALFFLRPAPPSAFHRAVAGFGLLLHLVVGTLAAFDWFMSLDPAFVSSAYGLIVIAAQCAFAATAALAIAVLLDRSAGLERPAVTALVVLLAAAAFLHFAQYLVVWSANLPKEIAWYLSRGQSPIGPAFAIGAPILLVLAATALMLDRRGAHPAPAIVALVVLLLVEGLDILMLASPSGSFDLAGLILDGLMLVVIAGLALGCALLVADRTTLRVRHG